MDESSAEASESSGAVMLDSSSDSEDGITAAGDIHSNDLACTSTSLKSKICADCETKLLKNWYTCASTQILACRLLHACLCYSIDNVKTREANRCLTL